MMEERAIIVILVKLDTGIGHFDHLLRLYWMESSLLIFFGFLLRDIDIVSSCLFFPCIFSPFAGNETKKDRKKCV